MALENNMKYWYEWEVEDFDMAVPINSPSQKQDKGY